MYKSLENDMKCKLFAELCEHLFTNLQVSTYKYLLKQCAAKARAHNSSLLWCVCIPRFFKKSFSWFTPQR